MLLHSLYLLKGRQSVPALEWTREQSQARAFREGWKAGHPTLGRSRGGWGSPWGLVVTREPRAAKIQTWPPPPTGQPAGAVSTMPAGRQRRSAAAREAQGLDTGDLVHPAPSPPGRCVDRPAPGAPGGTPELTQACGGTAPGGWGEERPAQVDRGQPAG